MPKTITVDKDAWAVSAGIVSGTIDFLTVGDTFLYTVPAGRRLIVTFAAVETLSVTGFLTKASITLGTVIPYYDIASGTEVFSDNPNTVTEIALNVGVNSISVQGGASVYVSIVTAATATVCTGRVIMKGILL